MTTPVEAIGRRARYRSPVLWIILLLATVGIAWVSWSFLRRQSDSPSPPAVDFRSADPAVASAYEQLCADARESPRSAVVWGRLGLFLMVYDFRDEARFCFAQAEELAPLEPRWPYGQAAALLIDAPEQALPKLQRTVELCVDDVWIKLDGTGQGQLGRCIVVQS